MGDRLKEREVAELARLFPPGFKATQLLEKAGFLREELPTPGAATSHEYWMMVNELVAADQIENGRRQVLDAAAAHYRYNPVFVIDRRGLKRVLFLGASPDGLGRLRADREYRSVDHIAKAGAFELHHRPAATPADLDEVRTLRPDVLHLVCHGDGRLLTFENAVGQPEIVDARDIAQTLLTYRDTAGVTLWGIVLNACSSTDAAELLSSCAKELIAHEGDLDDDCAVAFSAELYRVITTSSNPSLHAAARIAAQNLAVTNRACRWVRDNLVLFEGGALSGG